MECPHVLKEVVFPSLVVVEKRELDEIGKVQRCHPVVQGECAVHLHRKDTDPDARGEVVPYAHEDGCTF